MKWGAARGAKTALSWKAALAQALCREPAEDASASSRPSAAGRAGRWLEPSQKLGVAARKAKASGTVEKIREDLEPLVWDGLSLRKITERFNKSHFARPEMVRASRKERAEPFEDSVKPYSKIIEDDRGPKAPQPTLHGRGKRKIERLKYSY